MTVHLHNLNRRASFSVNKRSLECLVNFNILAGSAGLILGSGYLLIMVPHGGNELDAAKDFLSMGT